jgi:hypothetical protein
MMMKLSQPIILIQCLFLVALLSYGAPLARAQQNSVGISPVSIEAKVKRGATYTQAYTLFNNTSERLRFSCSVLDYWYDENNRRLTGHPGTLPHTASPWVQFSPSEIVVEPKSSATVKVIITVPLGAHGGYYTMPVFEALPVKDELIAAGSTENSSRASIGICFRGLIMLATEDANEYDIEVMGGVVAPPTDATPLEVDIDVRNRGTVHARVQGDFAILDEKGALAGRGRLESTRFLPGQRNILKAAWAGTLAPGKYTALVTFSYDRINMEPVSLSYEIPFVVAAPTKVADRK